MAKLSARGRTEFCRLQRVLPVQNVGDVVVTRAIMSDGHVLRKDKYPSGMTTGWKDLGSIKTTPEQYRDKLIADGYAVVTK